MNRTVPDSRSDFLRAILARIGAWRPSLFQIASVYALGFVFCWLSLWIGLRQSGPEPFVSPLYGFMLLFEEALRAFAAFSWSRIPPLPHPGFLLGAFCFLWRGSLQFDTDSIARRIPC
jgi:hypothetical protein